MKLSHSAGSRYMRCGYSHKLHYVDKLRPTVQSAALSFGSALDEAFNALLTSSGDPFETFEKKWSGGFINGKFVEFRGNPRIVYAEADFDPSLFSTKDDNLLKEAITLGVDIDGAFSNQDLAITLQSRKKQQPFRQLRDCEKLMLNILCWECLRLKAPYIIRAYVEEVMPKIKRVISVQKTIKLENEHGDTVEGFIDFIAEWEDGKIYIFDNKSSSRPYDEDAVQTSQQLALYSVAEDNPNAGFIVYQKNIAKETVKTCSECGSSGEGLRHKSCPSEYGGKRCGGAWKEDVTRKARIQILLGQPAESLKSLVVENMGQIASMINSGAYVRNLDSCNNWFGAKCPYYNYCHNGDSSDLEKVD